jgi:hypothetical protein
MGMSFRGMMLECTIIARSTHPFLAGHRVDHFCRRDQTKSSEPHWQQDFCPTKVVLCWGQVLAHQSHQSSPDLLQSAGMETNTEIK